MGFCNGVYFACHGPQPRFLPRHPLLPARTAGQVPGVPERRSAGQRVGALQVLVGRREFLDVQVFAPFKGVLHVLDDHLVQT